MSYVDLLERIQSKDPEAFLEMTERYGWAVYSAIREKHPDQAVADRIYDETMNSFYSHLSNTAADDPLEALLCAFADHASADRGSLDETEKQAPVAPPQIQLHPQEPLTRNGAYSSGKKNYWGILLVIILWIVLLALVWFIVGVMMAMDYMPFYDLGYSWFNANIIDFF